MSVKARLALLLVLLAPGCPGTQSASPAAPAPPPSPGVAPAASPAVAAAPTWAAQAELVARKLDAVVACVEKGDKAGALDAYDKAYFECYENASHNLEVASQRYLPEEPLDGKLKNVMIVREDLFAQVKHAVSHGAPSGTVRRLVDELESKVRADAKKLDEMKVAPP